MKKYIIADTYDDDDVVGDYRARTAFDPDPLVRRDVAKRTESPELLEIYAYDTDTYVREAVAKNYHTPADILSVLSQDSSNKVRMAVAANASTSADVLVSLAADPQATVRHGVANNMNVPIKALKILAGDVDPIVRFKVVKRTDDPDILRMITEDPSSRYSLLVEITHNPYTPVDILRSLANHPDWAVSRSALIALHSRGEQ